MNRIITLTSDLGLKDYYVGMIKGAILSENPNTTIVDITHEIKKYDIVHASFVIKNMYQSFPVDTIHLVGVNNFENSNDYFLVIHYQNNYFVGPDNGLFSLIFENTPSDIYRVPIELSNSFPLKTAFSKITNHLISQQSLDEIGTLTDEIEQKITIQPVITKAQLKGSVIHIDTYENVILNITQDLFTRIQADRPFAIYFKRYDPIVKLCRYYSDVPVGETLCLFNSAGYLEISINMGRAASMLGLNLDDTIQIDFEEETPASDNSTV